MTRGLAKPVRIMSAKAFSELERFPLEAVDFTKIGTDRVGDRWPW